MGEEAKTQLFKAGESMEGHVFAEQEWPPVWGGSSSQGVLDILGKPESFWLNVNPGYLVSPVLPTPSHIVFFPLQTSDVPLLRPQNSLPLSPGICPRWSSQDSHAF